MPLKLPTLKIKVRARRDRHKHGGGLTVSLGKALSAKDLKNMNPIVVSVSVLSLQFQRKSESVLVFIDLHKYENIKTFLEEKNEVISKALCKYENLCYG